MSLRGARVATGKGLNQAARESGVYASQLSQWENGKTTPDTRNLVKLATFYGVTVDELLRPDEPTQAAS